MLRVNNGVLVVPPFECAWLTGDGYTLRSGAGCLSFEAKGDTDVTVILKSTPGAKRLQPLLRQTPGHAHHGGGGNALQVEQNYTIIFGSHRNSCLKIEKNGVTQCMVTGVACSRVNNKTFSKYWIDLNHGVLTVGHGEPGQDVCHQWRDTQEIPGIQHIGLSCWDRHVSYRSMSLQGPLDFTRLQQAQLSGAASAVPSLFDATCAALMAATTPANVCRTLHVAELLLPTTQKLYRYCLDYIARHFETVVRLSDSSYQNVDGSSHRVWEREQQRQQQQQPQEEGEGDDEQHQLRHVSAAAMCDLVCQNAFSVDEQGIFSAVRDWAWSYLTSHRQDGSAAHDGRGGGAGCSGATLHPGNVAAGDGGSEYGAVRRRSCSSALGSLVCPSSSPSAAAAQYPQQHGRASLDVSVLGRCGARDGAAGSEPAGVLMEGAGAAAATPLAPGTPQQPSPSTPERSSASGDGIVDGPAGQSQVLPACRLFSDSGCGALERAGPSQGAPGSPGPGPVGFGLGASEEAASRVLSLIRFPLLPIETLQRCLEDPLLCRLPAVLDLVHEALEVHYRETGAGVGAATGGSGGTPFAHTSQGHVGQVALQSAGAGVVATAGAAAASGCLRTTSLLTPVSERRLVKPLPSVSATGGAAPEAAAAAAAAAGSSGGPAAHGGGGGVPAAAGAHVLSPVGSATAAGVGGAGVGGAAGDSCWSVRFQRRCLIMARELEYVCDGDASGVLHFLGTQYGSQGWVNPMLAKRVDVRASSPTGRTTDPRVIVGRQFVRTNFAGPRYVNGVATSWWQVDLGEQHQLAITYYTLRHDGSQDFARSWVLQGSHDLATWVDLKRHTHDTTIKVPGQYASWPVIGPAAAVPYRSFRLLLTAPNASPNQASRHNFCLSNLELYGFLHKGAGGGAAGAGTGAGGSGAPAPSAAAAGGTAGGGPGAGGGAGAGGSGSGSGCHTADAAGDSAGPERSSGPGCAAGLGDAAARGA